MAEGGICRGNTGHLSPKSSFHWVPGLWLWSPVVLTLTGLQQHRQGEKQVMLNFTMRDGGGLCSDGEATEPMSAALFCEKIVS